SQSRYSPPDKSLARSAPEPSCHSGWSRFSTLQQWLCKSSNSKPWNLRPPLRQTEGEKTCPAPAHQQTQAPPRTTGSERLACRIEVFSLVFLIDHCYRLNLDRLNFQRLIRPASQISQHLARSRPVPAYKRNQR